TTTNGNVQVIGIHDIATTNLTPLKTIVGQGYTMNINVTVANQGDFTETFNVTLYANTTEIVTKEIILESGGSATITFAWNTTGFAKGNYTLWAYARPVQGETDTTDNTFTNGMVYIGIPGDIKPDGIVDIYDALKLSAAYGSKPNNTKWDPNADINNDLIKDMYDALILAANFGKRSIAFKSFKVPYYNIVMDLGEF
ncbi:MAG: CARDB domain-containing protein, partial [Nitrososphaeria archaeon]